MLYMEIMAVCSQIHTKHKVCVQNIELLTVIGGTYSDHWVLTWSEHNETWDKYGRRNLEVCHPRCVVQ